MVKNEITGKKTLEISPLLGTILVALIGLIGTGIGSLIGGYNNLQLEKEKLRSSLILKAIETQDPESAINFLKLLKDVKLVTDLDTTIDKWGKDKNSIPLRPPQEEITIFEDINNPDREVRRRAVNKFIQEEASNPESIKQVLEWLNQVNINDLSPQGLVNVFYILKRTEKSVWTPEMIQSANDYILALEEMNRKGEFEIRPDAKGEKGLFKNHLNEIMKERSN